MLEGELGEGVAAAQFELDRDVVPMVLDGAHADAQLPRDLTARQAVGDQPQNAALRGSELFERGLLFRQPRRARAAPDEKRRQRGADVLTARLRPI